MNNRHRRRPPDETNEIAPAETPDRNRRARANARVGDRSSEVRSSEVRSSDSRSSDACLSDTRSRDARLPEGTAFLLSARDSLLRPISLGCIAVKVDDPLWDVVLRQSWLDAFADGSVPLLRWRRVAFVEQVVDALGAHPAALVCIEYTQADAKRILDLLSLMKREYPLSRCVVVGSRRWASREWGLRQAGASMCCWSPRQAGALSGLWLRHARLSPVLRLSPWKRLAARMPWPQAENREQIRPRNTAEAPGGPPSAKADR